MELEDHFSVHHLALLQTKAVDGHVILFWSCFVEPIFSIICISVNKWVEHETHLRVHHVALISTKAVDAHMSLMVPCFVAPALFDNSCLSWFGFFFCFGALFVCLTFLFTCTNIRCLTCASMRLDLPGHFVTMFNGTCR